MKSKAIIPLVVGLAVGLVAIKFTMDTVRKAQGSAQNSDLVTVVVARQDIPSTATIAPEMIMLQQTPRTPLLPRDTFTKIEELNGRVALKSIPQGSPVLPSMVAPDGTMPGLIVRVKEGYRAVAVKIDESSGVGYLVKPNDWVDVLAVMEVNRRGKTEAVSQLVLERVQVGAVGQVLDDGPKDSKSSAENTRVQTVTLLVKVDDVPKLHMAQTRGRITLAMRGNDDTVLSHKTFGEDEERDKKLAEAGVQPATGLFAALWKKAAETPQPTQAEPVAAAPVAPPAKTYTVTVINGSASTKTDARVDRVTFRDTNSMDVVEDGTSASAGAPAYSEPPAGPKAAEHTNPDFPDDPGTDEVKDDESKRQG